MKWVPWKGLENGCPTLFTPCDSHLMVKDDYSVRSNLKTVPESQKQITSVKATTEESLGEAVFCKGQTSSHLPLRTEPSLRLWRRNLSRMITTGSRRHHIAAPAVSFPITEILSTTINVAQTHPGQENRHESWVRQVYAETIREQPCRAGTTFARRPGMLVSANVWCVSPPEALQNLCGLQHTG